MLAAAPRRLAARDAARQGLVLRRGTTRRTTHAVFGRRLLARLADSAIADRLLAEREAGRQTMSENGFLRRIGALAVAEPGELGRRALAEQSGLAPPDAEDPDYGDAVFNLAALAFDSGDHATAERCWRRYLELDAVSSWARTAERGLRYLATAAAG